jgi:hypothetical protein
VTIDGMVEKPVTLGIDDLLAKMPLEERLYRHRCVEAWSMTVPWSGFAMKALVEFAKPQSGAKHVQMTSFQNPDVAAGQQANWYPWPYIDGLTMSEATDLAFLVTGALASRRRSRTARNCAWRRPRNTALNRQRASCTSPSRTSSRSISGRRSRLRNTASGPM